MRLPRVEFSVNCGFRSSRETQGETPSPSPPRRFQLLIRQHRRGRRRTKRTENSTAATTTAKTRTGLPRVVITKNHQPLNTRNGARVFVRAGISKIHFRITVRTFTVDYPVGNDGLLGSELNHRDPLARKKPIVQTVCNNARIRIFVSPAVKRIIECFFFFSRTDTIARYGRFVRVRLTLRFKYISIAKLSDSILYYGSNGNCGYEY